MKVIDIKKLVSLISDWYHVMILLPAIIRYLGSRFQETLSATDEDNRTALHYAATIKDNGHFYNLLVHLGANPKLADNVSLNKFNFLTLKIYW